MTYQDIPIELFRFNTPSYPSILERRPAMQAKIKFKIVLIPETGATGNNFGLEIQGKTTVSTALLGQLLNNAGFNPGEEYEVVAEIRFTKTPKMITPETGSDTIQGSNPAPSGLGHPAQDEDQVIPR